MEEVIDRLDLIIKLLAMNMMKDEGSQKEKIVQIIAKNKLITQSTKPHQSARTLKSPQE